MFDDFFAKAWELTRQGVPFATATVVRAEKPTSGKPGDKALVTRDGVMTGWIGGSCAQPTVVREAVAAIVEDRSRLIRLTPEPGAGEPPEGLTEVAMTCFSGGTLDIFIEPHQPRPRLLIVGNLPVARALAHLGKAMSYHVVAVDLERDDPERGDAAMSHADEVLGDLTRLAAHVTPLTFAVVATHGHFDEQALAAVLRTPVPYVGLVASRKRGQQLLADLPDPAARARVKVPAGLDIGARRGDEIALSIMAEIIQLRRATEHLAWPDAENDAEAKAEPGSCCASKEAAAPVAAPEAKSCCCTDSPAEVAE